MALGCALSQEGSVPGAAKPVCPSFRCDLEQPHHSDVMLSLCLHGLARAAVGNWTWVAWNALGCIHKNHKALLGIAAHFLAFASSRVQEFSELETAAHPEERADALDLENMDLCPCLAQGCLTVSRLLVFPTVFLPVKWE